MYRYIFRLFRRRSVWCQRDFSAIHSILKPRKCLIFAENQRSTIQLFDNSLVIGCRSYAKSKDKKKDKNKRVRFDENELKAYFDIEKLLRDLERPLDIFRDDLKRHATLRTSTGAIESLKVEFEGEQYAIQDLAEVGKKSSRTYVLDFSSFPGAVPSAMKVLNESELNLNVQQEGNKVIVPLPKVTKEHRELLARKSKLYFSKCKDSIRDAQMKYVKSLGKMEKLATEEKFRITDQLISLGNAQIRIAEELLKEKQSDLLQDDD